MNQVDTIFSGIVLSMLHNKGHITVDYILLSMLGGMVCMTGSSSVITTYEATFIGALGATAAIFGARLITRLKIDDPVGAIPVHFFSALWGTLAVGIFGSDNLLGHLMGKAGILHGGNGLLLAVNTLGAALMIVWSCGSTLVVLTALDKTMGIRISPKNEEEGADVSEHDIKLLPLQQLEKVLEELNGAELNEIFEAIKYFRGPDPALKSLVGRSANEAALGKQTQTDDIAFRQIGDGQAKRVIEAVANNLGLVALRSESRSVIGRASNKIVVQDRSSAITLPNIPPHD